ncbi:hypothetical protein MAR_032987, partial [Mya arenaria]
VACLVVQLLHVHGLNAFNLGSSSSSSSRSSPGGRISFSLSDLISVSSSRSNDISGSGETGIDDSGDGGDNGGDGGNGGQDHGPAHVGGDCSGCGSCYDPHAICVEFGCFNICVCEPGYTFIKNGAFQCGQCLPDPIECSCDDGDSCPCGDCEECVDGTCISGCTGCEVCVGGNECVELGHGDDCTLHPDGCCRDDLTCRNGICECEDENLLNDEDTDMCVLPCHGEPCIDECCSDDLTCRNGICECEDENLQYDEDKHMCLGDDLGEPCDYDDEPDPCTDKNNRTECFSDEDGNPVCICSYPYIEKDGDCVPPLQLGDVCGPKGDSNDCLRDVGIKCRSADCCGNANDNPDYPCNVKYCVCDTEWGFMLNATENGCVHSGDPVVPKEDCVDMVYE